MAHQLFIDFAKYIGAVFIQHFIYFKVGNFGVISAPEKANCLSNDCFQAGFPNTPLSVIG